MMVTNRDTLIVSLIIFNISLAENLLRLDLADSIMLGQSINP